MVKSEIRTFESGATRDTAKGKLEYFGFMHPLADYSFAKYMDSHRLQPDGSLRDSNNWWKGFNKETVIQSLCRHVEDLKLLVAGFKVFEERKSTGEVVKHIITDTSREPIPKHWKEITIEEACNAIRFNADAFKLEELRTKDL